MAYSFNARRLEIAKVDEEIRQLEYQVKNLRYKKQRLVHEYYFGLLGYKWLVERVQKKQLTSKDKNVKLNK